MDLTDTLLAALFSGAGAYASSKSVAKQQKQLNDLNNAMAQYRSGQAAVSRGAGEGYLDYMQQPNRAARQVTIDADVGRSYGDTLAGVKGFELPETTTGTGANYARVRAAGQARTDERLKRALEQMQALTGQQVARERDAERYGRAAYTAGAANAADKAVSGAYQTSMGQTQPDPYLRIAGEVGRGIGLSYMIPKRRTTSRTADDIFSGGEL